LIKEFKVIIAVPDGMDTTDTRDYIHEAISFMPGGYHPDDPRFSIDRNSIKVTRSYKRKLQKGILKNGNT
jgi:hypothetical protein